MNYSLKVHQPLDFFVRGLLRITLDQSHIERELRQLHSLQWNVFFTAMAARGDSQKFPEVAANTCSAIEMQQNKPFATHF